MYIQGKFKEANDDLTDVFEIRRKVFIEEQGVLEENEFDDYDKSAIFCVVYEPSQSLDNSEKEELISVATGRLILLEDGRYKVGRIAVLKEYRGKKYGDMVVKMLVNKAFLAGATQIYISAQTRVIDFYHKIGFQEYGEVYMEDGIEHIAMVLEKGKLCTMCGHQSQ
jgi:predicted GNAT family N-acyltransferase